MISKRIIPLFLLSGTRLVKGTRFAGPFKDVGDPLSQAMIYDAQGAEEIAIVDIDAQREGRSIAPGLINRMILKCRLPIAAGGGIRNLQDAQACFAAGADKIIVNTQAVQRPEFVTELATEFGAQSVMVSVDVRLQDGAWRVWTGSGTTLSDRELEPLLDELVERGAGEILLTDIDREGTLSGVDIDLYRRVATRLNVPLIASGGFGSYDQLVALFQQTQCSACALGKMLSLRDYDIVRIKAYLKGRRIQVREA